MSDARWPLRPRAARVFYNVADAWHPDEGAHDAVAALAACGLGDRERRRLERMFWWIEWSPRVALHSRRGFSWLPREARRAWLERLAARGPGRRAIAELRRLCERVTPC
jgi:hypothetical protein